MPLIVGIGASAGGLEAFRSFFANTPADGDFAYVLVQHLAPQHVSLLAELVGRSTTMPVTEAADGDRVEAGHVYVIPPDATLTIADGILQVSKPAPPRAHRWPINAFFTSLAEDQGDSAVCIVLSGTGSDGALGLRAVKEHGGLTLAQSGFDHVAMSGMPASAASTGVVDDILPVEDMPARLRAYRKQMLAARLKQDDDGIRQDLSEHLQTLWRLLRSEVGHDFSQYKRSTLLRRIQRRMLVQQTETVPDYIKHLQQHPQEYQNLLREMLIGVTGFFRDPPVFAALQEKAIPAMLAGKGAADALRVWVPACATGEEAYSIAILLCEAMSSQAGPKVQIFATDIDDRAIDAARAGRFRGPLQGISPERQQRWFTKEGDDYCVVKQLREMCVFSPHSVIKDPPFSRLDLVSCRNLLIYMNADLQERLFRTFHYALRPGAFLLLGSSESASRGADMFREVDKKCRLYVRRESSHVRGDVTFPLAERGSAQMSARATIFAARGMDDSVDRHVRRVLEKYSPAYVVVGSNHDVLRFGGDTGRYLSPSTGAASLNLFGLLHKHLREPARSVVRKAFASGEVVIKDALSIEADGHRQPLRLIAEPGVDGEGAVAFCVLAFDESGAASGLGGTAPDNPSSAELARIQALEFELESAYTQLHAVVDLHESVNEELKSANEEYQSVNEELQSANEELETSKEEMQSINEELQIVNAEANSKNETLTQLNSDLRNLLDSTQIATLFLDRDMRIGNYTPAMTELFHLREGDRGRPITEISARINYPELKRDVADVLRHLGVVEHLLQGSADEPAYLLRMRPYRTVDNVIDGIVLTFVDVTQSLRHEIERGQLAAIVDSSRDAIIGYTLDDRISSWNASAERIFGYTAAQTIGRPLSLLLPPDASATSMDIFAGGSRDSRPTEFETIWWARGGRMVPVAVTNSPVKNAQGRVIAGSLTARDIAERRRSERHSRVMLNELDHRLKDTLTSIQAIADHTLADAPGLQDAFLARVRAMSSAYELLTVSDWQGADLSAIVTGVLAPYRPDGEPGHERVQVQGDEVLLLPRAALALSTALHELTSNAVKHGALSVPRGRIKVNWKTHLIDNQPWLHLSWHEAGGPTVKTPKHRGFGTRRIADSLAFELDGRVALDFVSTGVRCAIDLPLGAPEKRP
ncbi:chemotaxis protein CheB [Rhodanobacter ginsengisoli]|uniref:Chemotaxis protein CheB n=1 Tax=Rhodanobacter ginsengisoli TaxID=418646 RepID=A0ABW0QJQ8_9GAMM